MRRAHSVTVAVLVLLPAGASAHSFGQLYYLPVPFWLYAWAGAAAVIVSFVVAGIFLSANAAAAPAEAAPRWREVPDWLLRTLQAGSLMALASCIVTGLVGTNQSLANLNMTLFWIGFVLGFAYLTAICGDLYRHINPWRLMCDGLSRLWPAYGSARIGNPERWAYLPAVLLYGGFIWVELFGKTTPFSLALWLLAYTLLNFVAAGVLGTQAWFRYGEIFSVMLRQIARLAPVEFAEDGRATFRWRRPFSGLLGIGVDHPTLLLFVLFMLSATAFDGLHEAKPWVKLYWTHLYEWVFADRFGHNPFAAFPTMRAIYLGWQSGWLLLSPLIYLAIYLGTIELMHWITGRRLGRWTLALQFAPSLLPIVLVYHITHYYTLLLTQGVRVIALISDPFGFGWNLFGTAGWLRGAIVPDTTWVWHTQVALILAGHIASVAVAHLEALRVFPDRRTANISQLPMLGLMVLFTVFGLWILSLPLDTGNY